MTVVPPTIRRPSADDVRRCANAMGLSLSEEEVEDFVTILDGSLDAWERLDELAEPKPPQELGDRNTGRRPSREDDPLNAVVTACRVEGSSGGALSDYSVGVKDNVAVAGIEMTCGSRVFEGYHPARDATVVTRLLDAGASITAKLNMEDMAVSGTGDQSATGPVLNPRNREHLAGGSSSGSAVAVVAGIVDVAIGTDQAGSIRIPAAINGCVGLKPTFGLVPYTGIVEVAPTIDHAGPMTSTVEDCALVLDAIAGPDGEDPRQRGVERDSYAECLGDSGTDAEDVTVGVLDEGLDWEISTDGVDEVVLDALDRFEDNGADHRRLSVPLHRDGWRIRNAIATEGHAAMTRTEGVGHFLNKRYDTQFANAFAQARRTRADEFPLSFKLRMVLGEYLADQYHGRYHMVAQNLGRRLSADYDDALSDVDVLAMPTVPRTALERKSEVSRLEYAERRRGNIFNTSPYNVTGHPALSVPCGTVDGLPVGVMFVGDKFDERTVLQVARQFESLVGWELDE